MDNSKRNAITTALAMLVALLPAGAGRAAAPSSTGYVTLRGEGSSYVDVVLKEKVTPRADQIKTSTAGSFAGYVITEHVGDLMVLAGGSVALPGLNKKATKAAGIGFGPLAFVQRELEPGTYRFELISDGPATVKIPVKGLSDSMVLTTTHAAKTQSILNELTTGPDVDDRWPVHRSNNTLTFMSLLQIVENHQASATQQCLKEGSENFDSCDQTQDYGHTGTIATPGSVGPGWVYSFAGFYNGYAVGEYTAVQHLTQAAASSRNFAFYLNVPMTAPAADNMAEAAPEKTFSFPYTVAGVQDQPACLVGLQGVWVGSCGWVVARPTDHHASVEIVDATGAPSAATIRTGDQKLEICGKTTEPLTVEPGAAVSVDVHAHPTLDCPDSRGTTGEVEVTLSP